MIKFVCRHCKQDLGEVESSETVQQQLGLHSLTPEERKDIITYMSGGHMVANVTCEYCQEALEKQPELSLISNPLQ